MSFLPNPFGFSIHHIFSRNLYTDRAGADGFRHAGIDLDARGNKVALLNSAETAVLVGSDPTYAEAGLGTSVYRGRYKAYDGCVRAQSVW